MALFWHGGSQDFVDVARFLGTLHGWGDRWFNVFTRDLQDLSSHCRVWERSWVQGQWSTGCNVWTIKVQGAGNVGLHSEHFHAVRERDLNGRIRWLTGVIFQFLRRRKHLVRSCVRNFGSGESPVGAGKGGVSPPLMIWGRSGEEHLVWYGRIGRFRLHKLCGDVDVPWVEPFAHVGVRCPVGGFTFFSGSQAEFFWTSRLPSSRRGVPHRLWADWFWRWTPAQLRETFRTWAVSTVSLRASKSRSRRGSRRSVRHKLAASEDVKHRCGKFDLHNEQQVGGAMGSPVPTHFQSSCCHEGSSEVTTRCEEAMVGVDTPIGWAQVRECCLEPHRSVHATGWRPPEGAKRPQDTSVESAQLWSEKEESVVLRGGSPRMVQAREGCPSFDRWGRSVNGISPEVADHRISLVHGVQFVGEVDVPPFEPFHEVERLKELSPPAGQDSIEWSPDFSRFARWAIRIWWQVQVVGVAVASRVYCRGCPASVDFTWARGHKRSVSEGESQRDRLGSGGRQVSSGYWTSSARALRCRGLNHHRKLCWSLCASDTTPVSHRSVHEHENEQAVEVCATSFGPSIGFRMEISESQVVKDHRGGGEWVRGRVGEGGAREVLRVVVEGSWPIFAARKRQICSLGLEDFFRELFKTLTDEAGDPGGTLVTSQLAEGPPDRFQSTLCLWHKCGQS